MTLLLLLPVAVVLVGVYALALPAGSGWRRFDSMWVAATTMLAVAWVVHAREAQTQHAGPIWGELLGAAGAYPLLAIGLGAGLAWRWRSARREPAE